MPNVDLKTFVLPQSNVGIPGTDLVLSVGALSFTDIVALFVRHKEIMGDLYLRFMGEDTDKKKVVRAALGTFISEAPDVAATVIAMGAGYGMDERAIETCKRFAFPMQAEALEKIATLTFGRLEDDAVKKFFRTVADALAVFNAMMNEGSQALAAGSDQSAGT